MTRDPVCCTLTDLVSRAAMLMKTENVGSVPVCESRQGGLLIGIVTDRDLALQVVAEGRDPNSIRLQDLTIGEPLSCHPGDGIEQALDAMQRHQVRRIPVVDDRGHWPFSRHH